VAALTAGLVPLLLSVPPSRGFQTAPDATSPTAGIALAQVVSTAMPREIKDIRFEVAQGGKEQVLFGLNGFYPPKSFSIDGDQPRVVCDFFSAHLADNIHHRIEVGGEFIQQIRIGIHKGNEPKVRVVLDLVPEKHYRVKQFFLKEAHVYTLIVGLGQ
jgi:hypothetical protein